MSEIQSPPDGWVLLRGKEVETVRYGRDLPAHSFKWPFRSDDRRTAWNALIEILARGGRRDQVLALASSWGMDDADAIRFTAATGGHIALRRIFGKRWQAGFAEDIEEARRAGVTWNLNLYQGGEGETAIDALAALARSGIEHNEAPPPAGVELLRKHEERGRPLVSDPEEDEKLE